MGTDKRQRQKEGHRLQREELARRAKRQRARRRLYLFGGLIVAFFAVVYVASLLGGDDDEGAAGDTTAATTTSEPGSTTTIESTTECPEADGSSPRTDTFETPPPLCIDPARTYTATIETSEGPITVDLDTANTPNTVNNFVVLSRYHYYDETPVFRTDPSIGIIQAGGESAQSSPGYTIPDEGSGFTYEPGQLVMARTADPDSAGAQFFLVGTDAASALDGQGTYVVFGTTDQAGIDVVNAILDLHEADPTSDLGGAPSRPVTIESVTIEER